MSGFLAIAGASAIAVGGGLACFRRLFVAGLLCQAAGAALVGRVGVVVLRRRQSHRRRLLGPARAAARSRSVERGIPGDARPCRRAGPRVRNAIPDADTDGARGRGSHGRLHALSPAGPVGTRSAALPGRLGADVARARGHHSRHPREEPKRPSRSLRLRRTDAPRGSGDMDRRAARRARGRHGVTRGVRDRVGVAGGRGARGPRRDGDEGRARAVAHVASASPPDRPCARLGADERCDGQGRPLRPDPRPRRVGRRAARVARCPGAGRSGPCRRSPGSSTPSFNAS